MKQQAARLLLASSVVACAPLLAANEFEQVWSCELKPGKSLDDARAASRSWLAAAKSMANGARLQVLIRYPIILSPSDSRFDFVVKTPSLAAWGAFYDGYDDDTAVADADVKFAAVASCSGSAMWESIKVD